MAFIYYFLCALKVLFKMIPIGGKTMKMSYKYKSQCGNILNCIQSFLDKRCLGNGQKFWEVWRSGHGATNLKHRSPRVQSNVITGTSVHGLQKQKGVFLFFSEVNYQHIVNFRQFVSI